MKRYNHFFIAFGLIVMGGAIAVTMLDNESVAEFMSNSTNWVMLISAIFLLVAFAAIGTAMETMKQIILKKEGRVVVKDGVEVNEEYAEEEEEEKSWMENLLARLQDSKPIEEEDEIDLDHNYDGIRELDNNLPPWWLYGFYITIIFAVIYLVRFHITGSAPLPTEEYEIEMAEAAAAKEEYLKTAANLVDESNVVMVSDESRIINGENIFTKNCQVCHANDGGGGVGPNLTDQYWIHGGSIADVFGTIKYGVPAKGMISWKDQLSPADMQDVASFILTLQGTTPANPKEPQGELYEKDDAAPAEEQPAADPDSLIEEGPDDENVTEETTTTSDGGTAEL